MNKYAVCYTWRSLFIKVKIPDSNSGDKYWPKKNYWGVKPAASHVSQFTGNDKLRGSVVKSFPLCHLVSVFRVVSLHWKPKPNTVARFSCECLSGTFQHWSWTQDRSISAEGQERAKTFKSNSASSTAAIFFSELDHLRFCASVKGNSFTLYHSF